MYKVIQYRETLATNERTFERVVADCVLRDEAVLLMRYYQHVSGIFATANRYEIREG